MTPEAATARRLASSLLRHAVHALAAAAGEPRPDERAAAREMIEVAVERFLVAPAPASYLAASRELLAMRRARAVSLLRTGRAERSHARGLSLARRELGDAAADVLARLPLDDKLGERLRALSLLAGARRELGERVAGQAQAMRKALGQGDATVEKSRESARTPTRRITRPTPGSTRAAKKTTRR